MICSPPVCSFWLIPCNCSKVFVESIHSAAIPRRFSASTWSFMRAIKGEMTIVMPDWPAPLRPRVLSSSLKAIPGICNLVIREAVSFD